MILNVILRTGQGQGQVTKGYYIQKSPSGHVIHVLWLVLAIKFNGYVILVVWGYFQKFLAKVRSRLGQKGQIFNIINVDLTILTIDLWIPEVYVLTYPNQFFAQESNGVFCFYAQSPEVTKKYHLKSDVINWYDFGEKTAHWGSQIELSTWNFVHWLMGNSWITYIPVYWKFWKFWILGSI